MSSQSNLYLNLIAAILQESWSFLKIKLQSGCGKTIDNIKDLVSDIYILLFYIQ